MSQTSPSFTDKAAELTQKPWVKRTILLSFLVVFALIVGNIFLGKDEAQPVKVSLSKVEFPSGWTQVAGMRATTTQTLSPGSDLHATARASFAPDSIVTAEQFQQVLNQNTALHFGKLATCNTSASSTQLTSYRAKAEDGNNIVIISYQPSANTAFVVAGEKSDKTLLPNEWECAS